MSAKVKLEVTSGPKQGAMFCFDSHDTFVFGRHPDCHAGLGVDPEVSRHHFILEANPPDVRVRDLGSRNGTLVNGQKHGGRALNESAIEAAGRVYPSVDISDGDVITAGKTTIRVKIDVPHCCSRCGAELIAKDASDPAGAVMGNDLCAGCLDLVEASTLFAPLSGAICDRCGADVHDEVGLGRPGQYVCRECQREVLSGRGQLKRLMQEAARKRGSLEPPSIEGYEIGELLGKGGMGAVYRAVRRSDGREVAVKIMLAKIAVSERTRRTFLREIEATRKLEHPNIVRLLASDAASSLFYFVMECCNGGSLEQKRRKRGGKLPVGEMPPIMLQCLDGLDHAHRGGFVHRDLKPQNVLLDGPEDHQQAKISDFGLAKNFELAGLSGMTATGGFGGTYHFMPREQLTEFKYARPVSDVWSMAATFYNVLTGCYPLNFEKSRDPMEIVLRDDPVPIRQRDDTLPDSLAEVIDRALSAELGRRYPSAQEFREAIAAACERIA